MKDVYVIFGLIVFLNLFYFSTRHYHGDKEAKYKLKRMVLYLILVAPSYRFVGKIKVASYYPLLIIILFACYDYDKKSKK